MHIYIYAYTYTHNIVCLPAPCHTPAILGNPILYTATTQSGWRVEATCLNSRTVAVSEMASRRWWCTYRISLPMYTSPRVHPALHSTVMDDWWEQTHGLVCLPYMFIKHPVIYIYIYIYTHMSKNIYKNKKKYIYIYIYIYPIYRNNLFVQLSHNPN